MEAFDLNQIWGLLIDKLSHATSESNMNMYIRQLTPVKLEKDVLYCTVPGATLRSAIQQRFYTIILAALKEITANSNISLDINVENAKRLDIPASQFVQNSLFKNGNCEVDFVSNVNPKQRFDTFVVGNSNRFALAASMAVANNPGNVYNPLFIYGGVGLGKTHLMHAIGHYIIDQNPNANVLYVTSEKFTNEVIEAVRTGNSSPEKTKQFRDKYRNIDVLLIDDIQFIIGKPSTQEEFFHTFNHLYEQKKQIVITSDKPPKDMDVLEERFKSRFAWGLIADIQFPDFETRMAILQKKVEAFNYNIDNDVLSYIANNVKSNIRELEGSVKKVVALANLEKKNIDIEIAKEALKDIVSPNSPLRITPENIISVVCDHYNVSVEDIKSSKRNKELVHPRQMIMYLCRSMTNATYKEIASLLGGRDHSTIMYGERSISDMIENDESTRRTIETIINKIKSD